MFSLVFVVEQGSMQGAPKFETSFRRLEEAARDTGVLSAHSTSLTPGGVKSPQAPSIESFDAFQVAISSGNSSPCRHRPLIAHRFLVRNFNVAEKLVEHQAASA